MSISYEDRTSSSPEIVNFFEQFLIISYAPNAERVIKTGVQFFFGHAVIPGIFIYKLFEDGEINICGKATQGGKNIGVPEGTWVIMFNDITGEFSIIAK